MTWQTTIIFCLAFVGGLLILGGLIAQSRSEGGGPLVRVGMSFVSIAILILAVIGGIVQWGG